MARTTENAADKLVKYSVFKHFHLNTNNALTSLNIFYFLSYKMGVNSETVSNRSRDSFNESGYQEVKSSKTRAWVVAGSVTFVVLCTIMAVTLPAALKDEKTTPAASASTSFPTEAPDTFTTISMSRSTSSTTSSISTTTFSPEIVATTNGDHQITTSESQETTSSSLAPTTSVRNSTTTFETVSRETTGSSIKTTSSSTLSNENTTAIFLPLSTPSAELTLTTRKPTVIPSSTPGFPTEEPDSFTTMSISRPTSSTNSTISSSSVSPEIIATTDGDHEITTSSTLSNQNTTATLLRTTEENTSAQSTTETAASSTLATPVLSTTTSYETTTVSIVDNVGECEYINELLEVDICVLDARYPLNHCNKNDTGCYELEEKCVHSIYMDWTLCGNYFKWNKCKDDETEEPELIVDLCVEKTH